MEPVDQFITIEGKKTHIIRSDLQEPRDTIIFLHGKSFRASTWTSINAGKRMNEIGLNFIAVDYPGWGESEENSIFYPPTRKYTNSATFIKLLSKELNLRKFSLLGASFSGPFVISFASRNPESINKIVLAGPVWSEDLSTDSSLITSPTLICYGENDTVISVDSFIKYKNAIKESTLKMVKGAGHALYLDEPDVFFSILVDHLK
jgi:pimeloyl-ACP methyl ester carboxylesterase